MTRYRSLVSLQRDQGACRACLDAGHRLCDVWRQHELRLLRPRLIVTVGGLARHQLGDAVAMPLPHRSGASSWLNDERNRARVTEAVRLVHAELARH